MRSKWLSKQLYTHPGRNYRKVLGIVELAEIGGTYIFNSFGRKMWCPQDWAAEIHEAEQKKIKMGRPSVGTKMLSALTVSQELKDALAAKAKEAGLSIPDARREAYRLFTSLPMV